MKQSSHFKRTPATSPLPLVLCCILGHLALSCGDGTEAAPRPASATTHANRPGSADAGSSSSALPTATSEQSGLASSSSATPDITETPVDAGGGSATDAGETQVYGVCAPIQCICPDRNAASCCPEALPYRLETVGEVAEAAVEEPEVPATTYSKTRKSVWADFVQKCGTPAGGCHVGPGSPDIVGAFQFTEDTFGDRPQLGDNALERVGSQDSIKIMPPGSAVEKRACNHPMMKLAHELKAFQDSGFADRFDVDLCPEEIRTPTVKVVEKGTRNCGLTPDAYLLPEEKTLAMTNLGSCIPAANHASCPDDVLLAKDKLFEDVTSSHELPDSLRETDIVSLDSEVLAANHVYSYSPTYTLFSDNAKKQRYVRVPSGQTIRYNTKTRDFDIPDNTRFYKTFLRQVVDKDGNVAFRKMETRLIVVRNDEALGDGKYRTHALRATYAWDKDEREAVRVTDLLNNGKEWADRMCPVVVNATMTRDPIANPLIGQNGVGQENPKCEYMDEQELEDASSGQVRHYAIPGSERCDQCHMGSSNHSYILGFNPWQADHRKAGEGGVYDPVHPDELTQLKRMIEYGVVEGIQPGEAKLEESQGDRKPRNDFELKAQAYMLGNCAGCHSDHGFPTVENPALAQFDLFPKPGAEGGVFQFPLTKVSPRIRVGPRLDQVMPYISAQVGWQGAPWQTRISAADGEILNPETGPERVNLGVDEAMFQDYGPLNSAIWRNVYTPFTYYQGGEGSPNAIFIHMPRNVPGYDCRAHTVMAEWMLSIPSRWAKSPTMFTEEVLRSDLDYGVEAVAARTRVANYPKSLVGGHCPDDLDIVDPKVLTSLPVLGDPDGRLQHSAPSDDGDLNGPRVLVDKTTTLQDNVPDHAHWLSADLTQSLGQWQPRRADWRKVLTGQTTVAPQMEPVLEQIRDVHLSPTLEEFVLNRVPMGLWSKRCGEKADSAASSGLLNEVRDSLSVEQVLNAPITAVNRWVSYGEFAGIPPLELTDRRVHSTSRGQAVFQLICQNCHGANYDSKSPLAGTIVELTGAGSRVADFRNGLFGPVASPGSFAEAAFTFSDGNSGATAAEWQARYMLFMGMGGTLATIPSAVLNLIQYTPFYGQRAEAKAIDASANSNMLLPATAKCQELWNARIFLDWNHARGGYALFTKGAGTFAQQTGHYQLWEAICGFDNVPMVRSFVGNSSGEVYGTGTYYTQDRLGTDLYPADNLVGDPSGHVTRGIQPSNYAPWCLKKTTETQAWVKKTGLLEDEVPYCPDRLYATAFGKKLYEAGASGTEPGTIEDLDLRARVLRKGGINAGLAVYYYLNGLSKGLITPAPNYDSEECAP